MTTRAPRTHRLEALEAVALRREHPSLSRISGFSDGVYAFAITLLILAIRIPHPSDSDATQGLLSLLAQQWRSYVAFVISFMYIGNTWANHRIMFGKFERGDQPLVGLNLLHLMIGGAFMPIPTAILGSWIGSSDHQDQVVAAAFYGMTAVVAGLTFSLMWWYAAYWARLTHPELTPDRRRAHTIAWGLAIPVMAILTAIAFLSPTIAFAGYIVVIVVYMFPITAIVAWKDRRHRSAAK